MGLQNSFGINFRALQRNWKLGCGWFWKVKGHRHHSYHPWSEQELLKPDIISLGPGQAAMIRHLGGNLLQMEWGPAAVAYGSAVSHSFKYFFNTCSLLANAEDTEISANLCPSRNSYSNVRDQHISRYMCQVWWDPAEVLRKHRGRAQI